MNVSSARSRAPFGRERDDRGVATVYACVGVVIMLAMLGLATQQGVAILARQRAENGADLAALAGAARLLQGPDVVCATVIRVAVMNGADVQSCSVTGRDVLVIVATQVRAGPLAGSAIGRARAGPVEPIGS